MRRGSQGGDGGGGYPHPNPCQRSKSSASMFKTRNEASSALPFGRPPTAHGRNYYSRGGGRNSAKQFHFNSVSETQNAFAQSKPNSYSKISSRFHPPNKLPPPHPHSVPAAASRHSHPVAPAITSFSPDPSYDSSLGGVSAPHFQNNYSGDTYNNARNCHTTSITSRASGPAWRLNSSSTTSIPYVTSASANRNRNMVSSSVLSKSQSQSQISLLDQKKRQWAKEREELSGLWSPWGKDGKMGSESEHHHPSDHGDGPSASSINGGFTRPGGNFATYSSSDHYLPPINDTGHHQNSQQNLRLAQRSQSLIPGNGFDNRSGDDHPGRKVSLPDGGRRVVQLQPYEQRTTFHKEGNAEWMIIHNGNGDGGMNGSSPISPLGDDGGHDRTAVISPRVIVHKIVMDATEERHSLSRIGPYGDSAYSEGDQYQRQHPYHHPPQPSPHPSTSSYPSYGDNNSRVGNGSGGDRYNDRRTGSPLTRSSFGGSNGYLGANKPPPVAMRSHLTIGLPSPRSRFGGSFEDIEKKEKQQWLHELEMQREEQRMRKLTEKDDKRARWGDKGVGVGHFWEPSSDSSRGGLPSRENEGRSGGNDGGGPSPPAWAKRSIQMQNGSLSQPNLYNGPLPAQMTISEDNMMGGRVGQSQGHIANFNKSSIELSDHRSRSRSPGGSGEQQRTFIRGQNLPFDLNETEEKERKARARQEYLEDVKKQIEDNKRRQKEEKEKLEREDREHERRMEQQRELEMQRLEMERRKKNATESTNSQESRNMAEPGIQIFEGGPRNDPLYPHTSRETDVPLHESPLIPNRFIPEPDAYELAIARRQVMTLSQLQSQSTEKSEPTSLSSETERNYSNNNGPTSTQRSSTPTPPTVVETIHNAHSNGYSGGSNDQCLMTDSDHIYERTLTPTQERRSRSMDIRQVSREFGTQTEVSDLTTDVETDREFGGKNKQTTNNEHSKRSKSISNLAPHERDKKEEKPRWGSNPEKKVYMKQSEKDPNYQKKLRRRQQTGGSESMHYHHGYHHGSTGETDTTANEYENENSLPFYRVQNRARAKERDRFRKSKSPLNANHPLINSQNNNYLIHDHSLSQSHSQSHVSSHLKTEQSGSETGSLNRMKSKSRSPPKPLKRNGIDKGQALRTDHQFSGSDESAKNRAASIAHKHLGHIRDGLNSVGGSEESCTGSGYTSPSSLQVLPSKTRPHCSTGDSNNSSLPSSASNSNSDYIPMFSTNFKSQREFDEMPIGGVKANPYLENAFIGNMANVNPVVKRHMEKIKNSASMAVPAGQRQPKSKNKPSPMAAPKPKPREKNNNNEVIRKNTLNKERQRMISPPVPALAKKMEMGLRPDGSGRISSLPPELLSPIPTIPLGIGPYIPQSLDFDFDPSPSITDGSRLSSAEPKVDIDIAITHASNPDLQELLHNIEQSAAAAALTARSEQTEQSHNPSLFSAREEELSKFPELISARSEISGKGSTRPVTNATDLSLQAQEEFIRELMSNREVQQQLSAREGELSEKGIIEFNIRLPSSFAPSALTSGKSRKASSRCRDQELNQPIHVYRDPLLSHSERRKATVQWLHSLDESSSNDAILTNLSSLKQGIKMQHELVHTTSDIYQ